MTFVFVLFLVFTYVVCSIINIISDDAGNRTGATLFMFICAMLLMAAAVNKVEKPAREILNECEKVLVEANAPRNLKCELTYEIVDSTTIAH
jgi:hypothetical protein